MNVLRPPSEIAVKISPFPDITSTAASGTNPVVRRGNFSAQPVSVCFHPEQPFKSPKFDENDWQLTAKSGHKADTDSPRDLYDPAHGFVGHQPTFRSAQVI